MARRRSRSRQQASIASPARAGSRKARLAVPLLVVAVVLAYANSLSAPFQFDDVAAFENEAARQSLPQMTSTPQPGVLVAGRPIVRLSFALNYAWGGLDVTGYHGFNIAVHIVCALLFFFLVRYTLSRWGTGDWQRNAFRVAFWSALIWALHPLNTGAVTYISARSESLMAMWYLATMLSAIQAHDLRHRFASSAAAVVFCALGMATKETMVTAPLAVLLLDRAVAFSSFKQAFLERGGLYAALAATWSILAALLLTGARADSVGFSLGVSSWTYLLNQAEILTDYLRRSFWPYPLVFAYGEPRTVALADVLPEGALIVTLVLAACWTCWKTPRIGVLALAFFVVLAPTSSAVPIATEVGAERRMYLPLMTLTLLVVLLADSVWRSILARASSRVDGDAARAQRWWRLGGAAVPIVVCMLLAALTIQRNTEYATAEGLWRSTLERWPSAVAHRNLAMSLWQTGRGSEAIGHLRATLTEHPEVRHALGHTLFEQGRFEEALVELRSFLDQTAAPGSEAEASARLVTAATLEKVGRSGEARDLLQELLARRPDYALAYITLADIQFRRGEFADAQTSYRRYLTYEPAHLGALTNLGISALNTGQLAESIQTLQRVVDTQPQRASAHRNLAIALASAGRLDEAIVHVEEALRLAPADQAIRELSQQLHAARVGTTRP
jgi:protein O-mannosyl-transferase